MKLRIEMNLDNAAFSEGGVEEVRRILNKMCARLPDPLEGGWEWKAMDSNGNRVGKATITGRRIDA